jgi:hypothetical protein
MHAYDIHHIGSFDLPEITIAQSLGFIVSCLAIATIASLVKTKNLKEL